MIKDYIPILIFTIIVLIFFGLLTFISFLFGPKKKRVSKLTPYECGVDPVGTGQERFPVSFFMTGIIFIIFSVVAVFLYLWAVIYRKLGEFGLEAMGVFLLIVMIGFVYVWMKGAFEWD